MYRLEIVTGKAGLPKESPLWKMFPRLFSCTGMYPLLFTVYGVTTNEPVTEEQETAITYEKAVLTYAWEGNLL